MSRLHPLLGCTLALGLAIGNSAAAQSPGHGGHGQPPPASPEPASPPASSPPDATPAAQDHSAHAAQSKPAEPSQAPQEPIPALTDADRAAAFPPGLGGHAVHDRAVDYMVLFDQLEWAGTGNGGPAWDNTSWFGGDLNRLWVRSEGEASGGRVENAFVEGLWGRRISRWWDVVGGVRQDLRPGPTQTWVGGGIQGLAPYFFEVNATGFVGAGGRTLVRLEAEYELLITNRVILQPLVEAEFHGKADPERDVGAGLSTLEGGLRLRYELKREVAPFVGLTWTRSFFGTADLARAAGEDASSTRLTVGVRTWF